MTKMQFKESKTTAAFFGAIARTSRCGSCNVLTINYAVCGTCEILLSIVQVQRREPSASSLSIQVIITTPSLEKAVAVGNSLLLQKLNFQLVSEGLPAAVIVRNATVSSPKPAAVTPLTASSSQNMQVATVVGGSIGGALVVILAGIWFWRKRINTASGSQSRVGNSIVSSQLTWKT
jgi:hypothetical protein